MFDTDTTKDSVRSELNRIKAEYRRIYRAQVADGNGLTIDQLPRFRPHIHPETGTGRHVRWEHCALSWCTWAGSVEAQEITDG